MTSETMGKIYVLIQRDYTKAALASRDEAPEKRKQCAEHLRKCAEIFKHDVCMFVDAELEKARTLLESEDTLRGHVIYPPSPEWLDGIGLDDRIWAREATESTELSNVPTYALAQELAKREGVVSRYAAPYEEIELHRTGPAVVLIVED